MSSFLRYLDAWDNFVQWFLNADWLNIVLWVAIALAGSTVLALSITLAVFHNKDELFKNEMSYESSTVRVYRIDSAHDLVRFFNLSEINNVRNCSLEAFYTSFPSGEQNKVRQWVKAIIANEAHSTYLETDVYLKNEHRMIPSFLKIVSADSTKGVIHLESYLLSYRKPAKAAFHSYSTEADFAQALKANGSNSGMTFCFALQPRETEDTVDGGKEDLTPEAMGRFREVIGTFVVGNQKILQANDNEIIIANFDMLEMAQAITFALRVIDGAQKALASFRKKGEPAFDVKAGIVANRDLLGDSDAILTESRRASENAYNTETAISFYKKGSQDFSASDELHYRTEVERIVAERKISYTYRPIFSVAGWKVEGYLARALPVNTTFASIDELKNYAARAKDEKFLFAAIGKNLVPRFLSERSDPSLKLYYPINMSERSLILPFFNHLLTADAISNLVFLFREEDIARNLDNSGISKFVDDCNALRKNHYEVGIILSGKSLVLENDVYAACDVFFVDFSGAADENMDTKVRSALHALVERLLKYKKPIIAANLMGWNAIELVVGSGIDFISSDIFAPYDTMFKPVTQKSLDRLQAMKERK